MVPISTSSVLATRTLAGTGRNIATGQTQSTTFAAVDEPLTYAHIGATGFYSDRSANEAPKAPEKLDAYGQSGRVNRFQEIFELQAASLASQQTAASQSSSNYLAAAHRGVAISGAVKDQTSAKKEMKWAISFEGNKVQIAINPNAA